MACQILQHQRMRQADTALFDAMAQSQLPSLPAEKPFAQKAGTRFQPRKPRQARSALEHRIKRIGNTLAHHLGRDIGKIEPPRRKIKRHEPQGARGPFGQNGIGLDQSWPQPASVGGAGDQAARWAGV